MELIHHIQCERDILKRSTKQSRLKIASYQKFFRIVKERHGSYAAHSNLFARQVTKSWWSQPGSNR